MTLRAKIKGKQPTFCIPQPPHHKQPVKQPAGSPAIQSPLQVYGKRTVKLGEGLIVMALFHDDLCADLGDISGHISGAVGHDVSSIMLFPARQLE